jgi:hypothetical protein
VLLLTQIFVNFGLPSLPVDRLGGMAGVYLSLVRVLGLSTSGLRVREVKLKMMIDTTDGVLKDTDVTIVFKKKMEILLTLMVFIFCHVVCPSHLQHYYVSKGCCKKKPGVLNFKTLAYVLTKQMIHIHFYC